MAGDPATLGFTAIDLAASFPQWVRRRKRTHRFLDETTVQVRMSVDIVLPDLDWFAGQPPVRGQSIYVPLDILRKDPLAGFSVTDADGRPVSVLNTHENGTLSTEGFSALVDTYSTQAPGAFRGAIHQIVTAPTAEAGNAAFTQAMNQGMAGLLPAGGQYEALLEDLRAGFLLLVPVTYQPDANHIFKLEWSAPYTWSKGGFGGTLRASAAALGLVDKTLDFKQLPIGFAHGTHFEFHSPESVRNLRTTLAVHQHDASKGTVHLPRRRVAYCKPVANVNVSVRHTSDVVACRSDLAGVSLRLRPRRGGPFMAIVVVTWLTTLLLGAVASRLSDLDAQSSSAVVLLLPVVLAAYLAREGEHAIASRMLAGVRVGGLAVSLLAFVAAGLIAVGDLRDSAPRAPQTVNCTVQQQPRAGQAQRQRRDRVRCSVPPPDQPSTKVNSGLQNAMWALTGGVGFVTLLLSAGLWSTHRATRAAAKAEDESNPDP